MGFMLKGLSANLSAGARIAFLRPVSLSHFSTSVGHALTILCLNLSLVFALDFLAAWPGARVNWLALPVHIFSAGCFFVAAFLLIEARRAISDARAFLVLFYCALPIPMLAGSVIAIAASRSDVLDRLGTATAWGLLVWVALILMRTVMLVVGGRFRNLLLAAVIFVPVWYLPSWYYSEEGRFWYASHASNDDEQDFYGPYREMNAEKLIYAQADLLGSALDELEPQRDGIVDLYFVGFAGYAYEDVFRKEVEYTRTLFDERFGTAGRSIVLVNHLETRDRWPLATVSNLAETLKSLGGLLNPEEDMLVLYLTSHGSADHRLAVDFWPLPLNRLTPKALERMLSESGIKWRMVMVSACYSGAFVGPLKNPYTAVATAAAATRQSFGCGNEFDLTYFGEALVRDQLSRDFSMLRAFRNARDAIATRERAENLEHSLPQLYVGEDMSEKLEVLESDLARRFCGRREPAEAGCDGESL